MGNIPFTIICTTLKERLRYRLHRSIAQFTIYWKLRATGSHFFISPYAILSIANASRVKIGSGVTIDDYTVIDVNDDPFPGSHANHLSALEIGDGTSIGTFNNIRASGGRISIGRQCLISQLVTIVASNHSVASGRPIVEQPWHTHKTGVTIGDDVWIGAGACIMPGVTIGTGSVIAANSVVTTDVDPNTIVAGIPARFLRSR